MKYLIGFMLVVVLNLAIADSISLDSYGEVKIGMPASDALKNPDRFESNIEQYDSDACCYLIPKSNQPGVLFMIVNRVVGRIDICSEKVNMATAESLGTPSDKKDVKM